VCSVFSISLAIGTDTGYTGRRKKKMLSLCGGQAGVLKRNPTPDLVRARPYADESAGARCPPMFVIACYRSSDDERRRPIFFVVPKSPRGTTVGPTGTSSLKVQENPCFASSPGEEYKRSLYFQKVQDSISPAIIRHFTVIRKSRESFESTRV
jgi:hypothetical protein